MNGGKEFDLGGASRGSRLDFRLICDGSATEHEDVHWRVLRSVACAASTHCARRVDCNGSSKDGKDGSEGSG